MKEKKLLESTTSNKNSYVKYKNLVCTVAYEHIYSFNWYLSERSK